MAYSAFGSVNIKTFVLTPSMSVLFIPFFNSHLKLSILLGESHKSSLFPVWLQIIFALFTLFLNNHLNLSALLKPIPDSLLCSFSFC